ncbi:MAG: hypothetical protein CHACPFDD_02305 [Phycisphaerae bacterium]|nr:hypothetical protein [Phycisphaerae bacterium]
MPPLPGVIPEVWSVTFSPDGQFLATGTAGAIGVPEKMCDGSQPQLRQAAGHPRGYDTCMCRRKHPGRVLPLMLCLASFPTAAPAQTAPRWAFHVGDRLIYERRAVVAALDTHAVREHITDQIQIWCLEKRGDEWLLLVDLIRIVDGKTEPTRGAVLLIDDRGRRHIEPAVATHVADMDAAFDLLPELRPSLPPAQRWTTAPDSFGRRWDCTEHGPDPQRAQLVRVTFTLTDPTGVASFVGEQRSGTYWFDTQTNCIARLESELQHTAAGVIVQSKTRLHEIRHNKPGWAALRADEARRYVVALGNEERLLADAVNRPAEIELTTGKLTRIWSSLAADINERLNSPFRPIALACQSRAMGSAAVLREAARRSERWAGARAAAWSLSDPAGRRVQSAEFRARPTVELFWSADSLWGLRALESARKLQQGLGERPVRVICLNMDKDHARAARAIDACGAGLTHVLAESLSLTEPPMDFPTLRLIDAAGMIRYVYVGWRPDYTDLLLPLIDPLLPRSEPAQP